MITLAPTESNTVTGSRFFNRDIERAQIREYIEAGAHLLLTGQRRTGKSSIAREIGRALIAEKGDEWLFLFVDLQACQSGVDLVVCLAEAINKHPAFKSILRDWLSSAFSLADKIEKLTLDGAFSIQLKTQLHAGNWQDKGRKLLNKIADANKRTYLVWDEFPDVVINIHKNEGIPGVEALLGWLRPEIQATVPKQKISLIISGSIGITPILRRWKLSNRINNLASYRLLPWKRATAKACLQALAGYRAITLEDEATEYLLAQIGIYIPQHIQSIWAKLYLYLQEEQKNKVTLAEATYVFEKVILYSESNSMITHYEERLAETLGEGDYQIAIKLLDRLSNGKKLGTRAAKNFQKKQNQAHDIEYILTVLCDDGYLDKHDNGWVFKDGLLRKWWHNRQKLR